MSGTQVLAYNGLNCDKFQFCIIKGKHELYISGLLSKQQNIVDSFYSQKFAKID